MQNKCTLKNTTTYVVVSFGCFSYVIRIHLEKENVRMKLIRNDGTIVERSFEEREGREAFWHSSAHVLAQAVKRLYPNTKCAIGPAIEEGFYYDFEFDSELSLQDLEEIEKEMLRIVNASYSITRGQLCKEQALQLMEEKHEVYKQELVKERAEEVPLSLYTQGEYVEICKGPHVSNTCILKAIKLTSIAGAYWRGNEKNKMLTRIYGISFPSKKQLEEYLVKQEEIKLRDHRKLGKELQLFALLEEGPGFPFFLPKGMVIRNQLLEYWRKIHAREGYVEISTPMLLDRKLWETSGHWEHYRENMYTTAIEQQEFALKPMNCPGGMLVYKMQAHSYKEFPLRIGELGLAHRHEKSGSLHGLMRVRSFTQDDAHIFMRKEQITDEIKGVISLIDEVYKKFGFEYHVELSTRPENSIGSEEDWEMATKALEQSLQEMNYRYIVNQGDGAFYGPKIDFHIKDSMGRTWQCGTIQLDFQLPARFHAEYIGPDGEKHRPIMIHRVVYGSIERFIGILIEHYAGKFPLWLSPVQVKVLPITDRFAEYAKSVMKELSCAGIRCEIDLRTEKLGYKIREAQLDKVPYMVIIGEKEALSGQLSIRKRDERECKSMVVGELIQMLTKELGEVHC